MTLEDASLALGAGLSLCAPYSPLFPGLFRLLSCFLSGKLSDFCLPLLTVFSIPRLSKEYTFQRPPSSASPCPHSQLPQSPGLLRSVGCVPASHFVSSLCHRAWCHLEVCYRIEQKTGIVQKHILKNVVVSWLYDIPYSLLCKNTFCIHFLAISMTHVKVC